MPGQGQGLPHKRERKRFMSGCPAPPPGGGKPHPYYRRACSLAMNILAPAFCQNQENKDMKCPDSLL